MSKASQKQAKPPKTHTLGDSKFNLESPADGEINTNAFENLRQKIESNLTAKKSKTTKPPKKDTKQTEVKAHGESRGKKRAVNGQVIEHKQNGAQSKTKAKAKDDEVDAEELKAIIEELGGGQEDIDMIEDAASDSEVEGIAERPAQKTPAKPVKGKTLESGMANILKEIALARDVYGDKDSDEEQTTTSTQKASEKKRPKQESPVRETSVKEAAKPAKSKKLKFQPRPDWFNTSNPIDPEQEPQNPVKTWSVEQLHTYARSLLEAEQEAFKNTQSSSSSQAFYNTVVASGTLSDKISALTLAVQESPLHNMKALEGLLGLAKKRSRSQAVDVLGALKDLLAQGSLLPSDRRLYTFSTQPTVHIALGQVRSWQEGDSLPKGLSQELIISWAYEDWLKEQYFEVLKILENWCNDEIEFSKFKAVGYVAELLREKPEQETNLLRLLINKLGDPIKKVASQASYQVMQLLSIHPAMKPVVVSAIESDFIFRPGQSTHAKYYAAVTLNQTALSMNEEAVAGKLLDIYFALFRAILKPGVKEVAESEEVKSQTRGERQHKRSKNSAPISDQEEDLREKLISALLTGVNRAYPYCGTENQKFTDHIDTLYQITHSANFNTSIQAMMLIQRLISSNQSSTERFYKTLYESLLDPRLVASSKQQLYLNLLHRSLKADLNMKRVKAFVKRVLQVLSLHEPSFVCGCFFLLKDLEKTFPSLATMIDEPEDHDADEEIFKDVDDNDLAKEESSLSDANSNLYDPSKRAPEHANADTSCMWEVLPYLAHYHPAVNLSADHMLDHAALHGKPDLNLHTLIHFLDRFVYKNAKLTSTKMRGSSIMQPMANDDTRAVLVSANNKKVLSSVNSEEFKNRKIEKVAVEDVFFHQYFNKLNKPRTEKSKKSRNFDEDGSIGSDDEDEVWKAMMSSAPGDLEGIEDDLDDEDMSGMSDFEAEMEDDAMGSQAGDEEDEDDGGVDVEAGIFSDLDEADMEMQEASEQADDNSDFSGLDSASDEEPEEPKGKDQQKKWSAERERKKKLKALPMFATAEDYAKMIDDDADEDLG